MTAGEWVIGIFILYLAIGFGLLLFAIATECIIAAIGMIFNHIQNVYYYFKHKKWIKEKKKERWIGQGIYQDIHRK